MLCGRRADTVRGLHEDRKQDKLMYFTIDMGSTYRKESKYYKININVLAMGPSRRTLKKFLNQNTVAENWLVSDDCTLRTPKLLCGHCAVCFY